MQGISKSLLSASLCEEETQHKTPLWQPSSEHHMGTKKAGEVMALVPHGV